MRRTANQDDDDVPMLEIELVSEPDEVLGAVEREPLKRRIRRRVGQVRRSARQIAVLTVSIAVAVAVGAVGMRMWDDRADRRANENTVAASVSLVQGGGAFATEPTSGTAQGSIQVVVHNVGPVPFFLIDVGTGVPNVRIVAARVVGDALIQPGHDGQFDVRFTTDCSRVKPPDQDPGGDGTAQPMSLKVRTAAQELRTVPISVLRSNQYPGADWTESQQFACGAQAPPPMIVTWPDSAVGFPQATIHGDSATFPITAILQRSRPATLRSVDALPGVSIGISNLPVTLLPRAPIVSLTLTAVVTDCAQAAGIAESSPLTAQVEDSGSSWATPDIALTADDHIDMALVGAIAKICGH